jgi:hypothetical protein
MTTMIFDALELLRTNHLANVTATASLVFGWIMGALTVVFLQAIVRLQTRADRV